MSVYGFRDGKFTVKKLTHEDKILVEYHIAHPLSTSTGAGSTMANKIAVGHSSTDWVPQLALNSASVTGLDYARAVMMVNRKETAPTRKGTVYVAGYDSQGNSLTELMTMPISSGVASAITSNNAFLNISSIVYLDNTGGTYTSGSVAGTVDVGFTNKFGLPRPIDAVADILSITYLNQASSLGETTKCVNSLASATLVNATYNTINLDSHAPEGSTFIIRYNSRWE